MTIDVARGAMGTSTLLNFQKINPIWPPRLHEILKMPITPVFVIEIIFDSMTIDVARGAMGTSTLLNFQKINPIWPPRLHEIIKMPITPSVFVIETSFLTL